MRTRAKVGEVSLPVEADVLALACVLVAKLYLVRLAHFFQHGLCLVRGKTELLNGNIFLDDLFHFRLESRQVVGGERLFRVEIVVEAAVNGGTYGKLNVWIQPLDSLRQNVGSGVPKGLFALVAVEGHYLKGAVLINSSAQVAYLTVQFYAAGGFVESHAYALDYLGSGHCGFDLLYGAVFQC